MDSAKSEDEDMELGLTNSSKMLKCLHKQKSSQKDCIIHTQTEVSGSSFLLPECVDLHTKETSTPSCSDKNITEEIALKESRPRSFM